MLTCGRVRGLSFGILLFIATICGCRPSGQDSDRSTDPATEEKPFQQRLYETAVDELIDSFALLAEAHPDDHFYVYCLYTNNDLRGVCPFANTIEDLEKRGYSPEAEEKWIPGEWTIGLSEPDLSDQMGATNQLLFQAGNEYLSDADAFTAKYGPFTQFKRDTLETLSRALLAVRQEGVFENCSVHKRIAFWVHIGDPMAEERIWMFGPVIEHLDEEDWDQIRQVYDVDGPA